MQVKLKVILSSGSSYDWSYQGAALSIGRDPECDMTVEDEQQRIVSWMHARIESDGDAARIRDFRSKNGTYINEEPVDGTRPIQIGDTIQLGRKGPKLIVLELDAHQEDTRPVSPLAVAVSSAPAGSFRYFNAWGPLEKRWLIGGALAAAVVVLLLLVNRAWLPQNSPRPLAGEGGHHVPMVVVGGAANDKPPEGGTTSAVAGARSTGFSRNSGEQPVAPPPPPLLTTEELKKNYSGALVWLGAELDGHRLPSCSGFVVDRTKIVCTASAIAELKGLHEEGKPVFVYCEACSPKFLRVVKLKVHPAYDPKNPTSSASLLHNVGVAIVESPLPGSVDLLPWRELPRPPKDMAVTAAGYSMQYEPDLKPYDPLDPPKQVWPRGRVRGTRTFPGGDEDLPLLELAITADDGTDGGPVFSTAGKVIGVLLRYGEQRYVVLSDQLSDLIR